MTYAMEQYQSWRTTLLLTKKPDGIVKHSMTIPKSRIVSTRIFLEPLVCAVFWVPAPTDESLHRRSGVEGFAEYMKAKVMKWCRYVISRRSATLFQKSLPR